jgi:Zn-dependent peptidase ImmA (M78 family)
MNTTRVGTEFENKVFDYVSSLLDTEGFLGTTKKYSKVFKHKKYKCAATDREIDFDITIETYNHQANSDEWSSLIILECKNYSQKVDIADLDEFTAKMNSISRSGIKGCMVSTVGYSRTEIDQAKKDHIALTVFAKNDMEWYTTRNTHMESEYLMKMLLGKSQIGCTPVIYHDGNFTNLIDFLKSAGAAITKKNEVFIPFYKDVTIKQKANELYGRCKYVTNDIAGETLAKLYPDVKIRFDDLSAGILGTFSFDEKVITISNVIIDDEHRRNFTLAHEIGHLCLHEPFMRGHAKKFVDYSMDKMKLLQDDLIKRMEQQANKFASFLLMPQGKLEAEVNRLLELTGNRTGRFYLDNQMCNIKEVDGVLKSLSQTFNVSKEAMKIRLIKEGLLIDNSKEPQRINRIIKKW